MRFLLCSLDSPGFVYPLIGLAKALQARGHEIAFVSNIGTDSILADSGCVRIPRGMRDGVSFRVKNCFDPIQVAIQVKHIEYALETCRADALVGQALTLGPLIAAARNKIPVGILGLCTYLWPAEEEGRGDRDIGERGDLPAWRYREMVAVLNQARALFRLSPIEVSGVGSENPLLGDLYLIRSVPELEPYANALPDRVHLVGDCLWESEGPELDLDQWLAHTSGLPLIYVQHGRSFEQPSFWSSFLDALPDLPVRVAASLGRLGRDIGTPPAQVFARAHVPQGRVLPLAQLLVATANTTAVLGALTSGVPCLLIPGGGEQPDVAQLCRRSGVAQVIAPEDASPGRIIESIKSMLSSVEYAERAAYFRKAFSRYKGAGRAVDLLESLAGSGAPMLRKKDLESLESA